jgi:hypothetical protein
MRNFNMFTTVMYGFINEVTRQPASADIPLRSSRQSAAKRPAARPQRTARPAPGTTHAQLPGRYRVIADSFKRAAGFH